MISIVCLFSLLCTVYSLRVVDAIELPPRLSYKGCQYERKLYQVGQFKPNDCMSCDCQENGQVICAVMDCAPPPCSNPVRNPGQCCAICKGVYGPGAERPVDPRLDIPQAV